MARKFLVPIDLTKNELQNARIQNLASDPQNAVIGQIYFNTVDAELKVYSAANTWSPVGGGSAITTGTFNQRPAASTLPVGSGFYATDNEILYVVTSTLNGNVWSSTITPTSVAGIPLSAMSQATADISMGSANAGYNKITNLASPTQPNDAANKAYVDAVAEGLHVHASVVAGSIPSDTDQNGVLDPNFMVYDNGSSGVGATLTNSQAPQFSPIALDGVSLAQGDRVLIKSFTGQIAAAWNGIYTVTTVGVNTAWVLTRATDFDTSAEVDGGDFVFVTGGNTLDNTGWVQTVPSPTIGSSPIVFTQFSGAGTYTAGAGLELIGNQFEVKLAGNIGAPSSGLEFNQFNDLKVKTGTGLSIDQSGFLEVNDYANIVRKRTTTTVGDGQTTSFSCGTVTTPYAIVTVVEIGSGQVVEADVSFVYQQQSQDYIVTVSFAQAPSINQYYIYVSA